MVYLNALWPQLLADVAQHPRHLNKESARRPRIIDTPVIHVSTDCVFGAHHPTGGDPNVPTPRGRWNDANPDTLYGRTKLAGESEYAINVRTSFVGPRHGLWAWLLEQAKIEGARVDGWMNAWWSGSTVDDVAAALLQMARDPGEPRTVHLATETPINKFNLLCKLAHHVPELVNVLIDAVDEPRIDRSLHPDIVLRPFSEALADMVKRMEVKS